MLDVFFHIPGEDEYVTQIHKIQAVQHVTKDHGLKNCRGVGEAKAHHEILKMARRVLKAGSHSSSSLMKMRWKALRRSNLKNAAGFCRGSKEGSIRGRDSFF